MKIRLVSDLHIDINDTYGIELPKDDVFTLIAGDICGTVENTIKWIGDNVTRGAFCAGNHIVYNPKNTMSAQKVTIEDVKGKLHESFPLDADVTFFDYDVGVLQKEICENVLLVSDVMYTDYRLKIPYINPKGLQKVNMRRAEPHVGGGGYLNDFVYGFTRKPMFKKDKYVNSVLEKGVWPLRAKYYKNHHNAAWKAVTEIVEANPDKNIILMTHHCLSPKCISSEYVNDELNASYVSNKERWIKAHPNVKLILSGHVHHRAHFRVGGTLYVLNPLGYCRDTLMQYNEETKQYDMWTPDCFVDTDTWELSYSQRVNPRWEELHELHNDKLMKLAPFFI